MSHRAFYLELLRTVRHSLGRFIALAAIIALGCGFYAGLRMTPIDMKLNADAYFDGTQLMDVRVVSTLGLDDGDLEALRDLEGVRAVAGARQVDASTEVGSKQYTMRVHSLDPAALDAHAANPAEVDSAEDTYLNRLVLEDGDWPRASGECVVSADVIMDDPIEVGDKLRLVDGTVDLSDALATMDYTVVGTVHSPLYATTSSLGSSTLGSGRVNQYLYVPASDFSDDLPYTEAYLTVEGAADELSLSGAYKQVVAATMARVKGIAPERERARTEEVKGKAQAELDDERASFEQKRADALAELDDARAKLDQSAADMENAQRELDDGEAAYASSLRAFNEQSASAQEQLEAGKRELEDRRAQLARGERALDEAQAQLDESTRTLADSRAKIEAGQQALADARAQHTAGAEALAQAQAEWESARRQLEDALAALDDQIAGIDAQIAALDPAVDADRIAGLQADRARAVAERAAVVDGLAQSDAAKAELDARQQALDEAARMLDAREAELVASLAEAEAGADALAAGQKELDGQRETLGQAHARIDEAARTLATAEESSAAQIAQARAQLDAARAQLDSAAAQLADGRAAYANGWADYEAARTEAQDGFAEAEDALAAGQADIDAIEPAEWLVMDRTKNIGAVTFDADADRIDRIASVFPLIFFLVAALVSLTTMTRMVEEERMLIGTFKALGYSRARISSKYLLYALVAGVVGSALGIVSLGVLLPSIIMNAYAIIYSVPTTVVVLDAGWAVLSAGLGVGITLLATLAVALTSLAERPSALLLPRAPKAGKRILLERVTPVWRRLSFSWKVCCRNIFRYKQRLFMTVIGIAGCTALLLTGLGLHNAINDIIDLQWGQIMHYNAVVTFDEDASDADKDAALDLIGGMGEAESSAAVHVSAVSVESDAGADKNLTVVAPADCAEFAKLVTFRERIGGEPIAFDDDSAVIDEKLADVLGFSVGDVLTVAVQDDMGNATAETYDVPITGIMENYVYDYLFIGPAAYEAAMGKAPTFDSRYALVTDDQSVREQLDASLFALDGVKTISYTTETLSTYRTTLKSVNSVVIVLVVSAAALAFIVLYNLTNINISERMREIATLKVLGFTKRETDAYVFREIALLAVAGSLAGLALGVFLEGFVVVSAELDYIMFGRQIHALSFAGAVALTLAFAGAVMLAMKPKLARIDMVESLKSNE